MGLRKPWCSTGVLNGGPQASFCFGPGLTKTWARWLQDEEVACFGEATIDLLRVFVCACFCCCLF